MQGTRKIKGFVESLTRQLEKIIFSNELRKCIKTKRKHTTLWTQVDYFIKRDRQSKKITFRYEIKEQKFISRFGQNINRSPIISRGIEL